jgi:hypothetical protein
MGRFLLQAEHLGSELYPDGSHGAIKTAGAAMPALVRILDRWKLLPLVKMDYIQRAMQVTGSAFLALFHIDHRRHGLLLSPLFSRHRGGITS